jgi:hypothetical protein
MKEALCCEEDDATGVRGGVTGPFVFLPATVLDANFFHMWW